MKTKTWNSRISDNGNASNQHRDKNPNDLNENQKRQTFLCPPLMTLMWQFNTHDDVVNIAIPPNDKDCKSNFRLLLYDNTMHTIIDVNPTH